MRKIILHPVRTNKWRNHWFKWPRSKQALASVLLWASRAEADRITFDPHRFITLIYSNQTCQHIKTEVPPPPYDLVESFLPYLRDIAAGDELFGLIRKEVSIHCVKPLSVVISVPDVELKTTYRWLMKVDQSSALFESNTNLAESS